MLNSISSFVLVSFILFVLIYAKRKDVMVYEVFVNGAKKGVKTSLNIFPFLLAFCVSVSIFRDSGLSDFIVKLLSPICNFLHFKSELLPLMLFRPLSGSGASAVLMDIFKVFTPDSFIGIAASVMMGSTETTLYVLNVYLANEKIKDIRYALKACLIADFFGMIFSYIICVIFFKIL